MTKQTFTAADVHGALYDFAGFLTTRDNVIPVGASADAVPMADLVKAFADKRGIGDADASVTTWQGEDNA